LNLLEGPVLFWILKQQTREVDFTQTEIAHRGKGTHLPSPGSGPLQKGELRGEKRVLIVMTNTVKPLGIKKKK